MGPLYQNIKKIAERKKIQQKEIAKVLNVGPNTVNNWFQGKTSMKAEQIPIIASLLRVSIQELFKRENEPLQLSEPAEKYSNCPECSKKQERINELLEKNSELHEKYTNCMEQLMGKKGNDVANSA